MAIDIDDKAEFEMRATLRQLDARSNHEGDKLVAAFETIKERISVHPEMYGRVFKSPNARNIRIAPMAGTSYQVVYPITGTDSIIILAIAHNTRKPFYWKNRGVKPQNG